MRCIIINHVYLTQNPRREGEFAEGASWAVGELFLDEDDDLYGDDMEHRAKVVAFICAGSDMYWAHEPNAVSEWKCKGTTLSLICCLF